MLRIFALILLLIVPFCAQAKIVKNVNPDGTVTYTNINEAPPKKIEKDDPNVGDEIDGVKVLNITTKIIGASEHYVDVSIRLKVRNNSRDEEISIAISGLDSGDFERYHTYITGRLKPNRTGYISGVAYVDREAFQYIKKWIVK